MRKYLVMSAFTNYQAEVIYPWYNSLRETGYDGDVIVVALDATKETLDKLTDKGIKIVTHFFDGNKASYPGQHHVVVDRFFYYWKILSQSDYTHILTTDISDVIFQKDFRNYVEGVNSSDNEHLILSSEGINYKNEEWGNANLYQSYGPDVYEANKENEIFNAGVVYGTSKLLKDLCWKIWLLSQNRPVHNPDQAAFNILINSIEYSKFIHKQPIDKPWACQAGTVANPNMMDKFRPHLLYSEPAWSNNTVYTAYAEPYCIVHQYNRVPTWNEYFKSKYLNV